MRTAFVLILISVFVPFLKADEWQDITTELDKRQGLFDLYIDETGGKIWAALPSDPDARRYLYKTYISRGLGSNPVGLDRTAPGPAFVVAFERYGPKLALVAENWTYRATGTDLEKRAVRQSFARSILWTGDIAATGPNGVLLVDITSLISTDKIGLAQRLKQADQGSFSIDKGKTLIDPAEQHAFPINVELDALVTLTSAAPGIEVRQTTPDPTSVTLGLHHSFLKLPDDSYEPRLWDARTGTFHISYADYSADLDADLVTRLAQRHRLQKQDPSAASGPVKKPIVYYVDAGAPPAVRDALIEGASWWADAFAAAGFQDAFQVKVLPADVHPLDARYNVISWVHRQTRGWSYGPNFTDPRTGEILKAHVVLGSLRVRQDRLIFETFAGKDKNGTGAVDDPTRLALERIKQLSAHEVGHTLGLAHNFAASAYGRQSVMDYPAPYLTLDGQGGIDFSQAYRPGMGDWDSFAISWLYSDAPEDMDTQTYLDDLVEAAQASNLAYISDAHARSPGASHPLASLWDNGTNPVMELENVLAVRAHGLADFGTQALDPKADQSDLRHALVPLYLYHRYQTEAAAKLIGGRHFAYKRANDDDVANNTPVSAAEQRRAIAAVMQTLSEDVLALDQHLVSLLVPRPSKGLDLPVARESFTSDAGSAFDPLAAAEAAAGITLNAVLHPDRAYRLIQQHAQDSAMPGLEELLTDLEATLLSINHHAPLSPLRWRVASRAVTQLIALADNGSAALEVRVITSDYLQSMKRRLDRLPHPMAQALSNAIQRHLTAPSEPGRPYEVKPIPPGSPIGQN